MRCCAVLRWSLDSQLRALLNKHVLTVPLLCHVVLCVLGCLSCSPVRLCRSGIEEFLPLGPMNDLEQRNYDKMLNELADSIQKGIDFVQKRQQQQQR